MKTISPWCLRAFRYVYIKYSFKQAIQYCIPRFQLKYAINALAWKSVLAEGTSGSTRSMKRKRIGLTCRVACSALRARLPSYARDMPSRTILRIIALWDSERQDLSAGSDAADAVTTSHPREFPSNLPSLGLFFRPRRGRRRWSTTREESAPWSIVHINFVNVNWNCDFFNRCFISFENLDREKGETSRMALHQLRSMLSDVSKISLKERILDSVWTVLEDRFAEMKRLDVIGHLISAGAFFYAVSADMRPRKLEVYEDACERRSRSDDWRMEQYAARAGSAVSRGSLEFPIVIVVYYGMFWLSRTVRWAARALIFFVFLTVRRVNESVIVVNAGAK